MKKGLYRILYLLIVFTTVLSITGCKKKYKVSFFYEDGTEIISIKVEKGSSIGYPSIKKEEGYYYEWSKTPQELTGIEKNIEVFATKKECQKVCKYYIDGEIVKEEKTSYSTNVEPAAIPSNIKDGKWIETLTKENNIYYYDYVLEGQKEFNVTFKYDDGVVIKIETIIEGENTTFPPIKEALVGYYYEWDKTLEDLTNIKNDLEVTAISKECKKVVKFYIDNTFVKEEIVSYSTEVEPPVIPSNFKNVEWIETINKEGNIYYYDYHLEYDIEYIVTFMYEDSSVIKKVPVLEGGSITFPTTKETETGYYYEWDKKLEDLTNIDCDLEVRAILRECSKIVKYYVDGLLTKEETLKYTSMITYPTFPDNVLNPSWKETIEKDGNIYYYNYNLEYECKIGKISYYDGSNKLDLNPSVYRVGETVTLPSYEKENAYFIGWFVSDISLCKYNEYTSDESKEVVLYARFVSQDKPIELPESTYKFTEIKKNPHSSGNGTYIYQPVMPNGVSTTSVTQYNWSTSDSTIATVSAYSSITAKKAGFCVLKATLKTDSTVTINCLIRVSTEGVFVATIEEANEPSIVEVTFVDKDDQIIEKQYVKKGQYAIPPVPKTYENLAFNGWDKDIYNIKENTTIKATYVDGNNPYVGKKVAIIGDSISTYQDYIPTGFASFYPYPTADVNDVNQTWWMQTINKLGASLLVNNSYSGSCVVANSSSSSTNDSRLSKLIQGSEKPDVIIIYMGSNDCASTYVGFGEFEKAYQTMIAKIKKLCENTEIVVCTLPTTVFYSKAEQIKYNSAILDTATSYSLKVVHLDEIDVSAHLVDSAHPKKAGMDLIANKVIEDLLK